LARQSEQSEAIKQIQALSEWATSADVYAKAKVEEVEGLYVALEAEQIARQKEQNDALQEIQRLTELYFNLEETTKFSIKEYKEYNESLEIELAIYREHWFLRLFGNSKK